MFSEQLQKAFLEGEDRKAAYREFIKTREWPEELAWDGQKHASCSRTKVGTWRLTSWGWYQGSDWRFRWYVGHRCTQCGIMVQHVQIANDDGTPAEPVRREVFIP